MGVEAEKRVKRCWIREVGGKGGGGEGRFFFVCLC